MNLPTSNLPDLFHAHGDSILGALLGGAGGLAVTTGAIALPEGTPEWLKLATPIVGMLLPLLVGFFRARGAGKSAGLRIRAAQLRNKAGKARQKSPPDEAAAAALDDQADALDVQAGELDAENAKG